METKTKSPHPDSLRGNASHIELLVCGGTIDNIDLDQGTSNEISGIEDYLRRCVKPYFGVSKKVLFMKDSRDVNQADRELICDSIQASPFNRFLVTHGTFTMAETGRYLKSRFPSDSKKTVIVVGSIVPLGEKDSDAPFNLGFACSSAMFIDGGVWIAFNGRIWDPDDVEKNLAEFRFQEKG